MQLQVPFGPTAREASSWLVIKHHPIWEFGGLGAKLRNVFNRYRISLLNAGEDVDDLRVSIAWSLGGSSIKEKVLACN